MMSITAVGWLFCLTFCVCNAEIPLPNLYWNFNDTCDDGNICVNPTIPEGDDTFILRTGSSTREEPYVDGVVGTGLRLAKVQITSDGIFRDNHKCITSIKDYCTGFTVAFWLKVHSQSSPTLGIIFRTASIDTSTGQPTSSGVSVVLNATQALEFYVQANDVFYHMIPSEPFSLDEWFHLTLVWKQDEELEFYMNGTSVNGVQTKTDKTDSGERNQLDLGQFFIDVSIDELKIWYEAYPPENVTVLMTAEPTSTEGPTTESTPTTEAPNCSMECSEMPMLSNYTQESWEQWNWVCEYMNWRCEIRGWIEVTRSWWITSCSDLTTFGIEDLDCPPMDAFNCCTGEQKCLRDAFGCKIYRCENAKFRDIGRLLSFWKSDRLKYKEMMMKYKEFSSVCETSSSCDSDGTGGTDGNGSTNTTSDPTLM